MLDYRINNLELEQLTFDLKITSPLGREDAEIGTNNFTTQELGVLSAGQHINDSITHLSLEVHFEVEDLVSNDQIFSNLAIIFPNLKHLNIVECYRALQFFNNMQRLVEFHHLIHLQVSCKGALFLKDVTLPGLEQFEFNNGSVSYRGKYESESLNANVYEELKLFFSRHLQLKELKLFSRQKEAYVRANRFDGYAAVIECQNRIIDLVVFAVKHLVALEEMEVHGLRHLDTEFPAMQSTITKHSRIGFKLKLIELQDEDDEIDEDDVEVGDNYIAIEKVFEKTAERCKLDGIGESPSGLCIKTTKYKLLKDHSYYPV